MVNVDRDVEKRVLFLLLSCVVCFLWMGSCPGHPGSPGLAPLHCRWDPGRCDLRPTGKKGLHLRPDAAAGGPDGEPSPAAPLPCVGPESPEAATLPTSKHGHIWPELSHVHGSWFLDAGHSLQTPPNPSGPSQPTPLDASHGLSMLMSHLFTHPWLPVRCSIPVLPIQALLSL